MKNSVNSQIQQQFTVFIERNWLYYKRCLTKSIFQKGFKSLSFNNSAFLFQNYFFFYRKMFFEGFVSTIILFLIPHLFKITFTNLFSHSIFQIISFCISYTIILILHGFLFNSLYFAFIRRKLKKYQKEYGHDEYLFSKILEEKGGTSLFYTLGGIFFNFFLEGLYLILT